VKARFRPVRESDLGRLREIVNDQETSRYLTLPHPVSKASTLEWYRTCRRKGILWAALVVDGRVAGSFNLTPGERARSHCAGFGISIGREYWGLGLGGKTLEYAIAKARRLGFKRLELSVFPGNTRAIRLYRSRGFVREGVRRRGLKVRGRYYDDITMARLL
jgi:RimJ/RimL family protein N-acetyltransferase